MPKIQKPLLPKRKLERFRALRGREDDGLLTDAERAELEVLNEEMDQNEAAMLQPSLERMRHKRKEMEAQIVALEAWAKRKETFIEYVTEMIAEIDAERVSMDEELARIVGDAREPVATGARR